MGWAGEEPEGWTALEQKQAVEQTHQIHSAQKLSRILLWPLDLAHLSRRVERLLPALLLVCSLWVPVGCTHQYRILVAQYLPWSVQPHL